MVDCSKAWTRRTARALVVTGAACLRRRGLLWVPLGHVRAAGPPPTLRTRPGLLPIHVLTCRPVRGAPSGEAVWSETVPPLEAWSDWTSSVGCYSLVPGLAQHGACNKEVGIIPTLMTEGADASPSLVTLKTDVNHADAHCKSTVSWFSFSESETEACAWL
jgi:hypothetical protein